MAGAAVRCAAARVHCPSSEAVVIDIPRDLGCRGVADGQVACQERSLPLPKRIGFRDVSSCLLCGKSAGRPTYVIPRRREALVD